KVHHWSYERRYQRTYSESRALERVALCRTFACFLLRIDSLHGALDCCDDVLIPHGRIQHHVVEGARGPVSVEVMADKFHAVAVHGIEQFVGFAFAFSRCHGAPKFFRARSIEKNVECVRPVAQKVGRAAAHENAVALLGRFAEYLAYEGDHAIGVEGVHGGEWSASFKAAAPEDPGQAMKTAVQALFATPDHRMLNVSEFGDFLGELLVPKLPAESA